MLKNVKIFNKLFLNTALTVGFFIIALVIYNNAITRISEGYTQLVDHEYKILDEAEKCSIAMLEMRRNEKDFLLRKDKKYVDKHNANMQKFLTSLKFIETDSVDTGHESIINHVKDIKVFAADYKKSFEKLAESWEKSGFKNQANEDENLKPIIAQMRDATHKVEPLIQGDGKKITGIIGEIKEIVKNKKADLDEMTEKDKGSAALISVFAVLFGIVFSKLVSNSIIKPLSEVVETAEMLSQGDLRKEINLNRKDEIGQLSNSLNKAITNLKENINFLIHNSTDIKNASHRLHNVSEELSGGFEGIKKQSASMKRVSENVAQNMQAVKEETNGIAGASSEVKDDAGLVNTEMITVAAALEQSQTNVQSIASASEQMSTTINEIAANTERCRNIAENAVSATEKASSKVGELSMASSQIEKIILVIEEISEQTKNLALNATIEAARAGEAGKGFAVVANEVKELARQTNEATVEVKNSIMQMAMCSDETVGEIGTIQGVIAEVNEIVSSIATAIEEQSINVQDNSKNTTQAAEGLLEVTKSVSHVSTRVEDITSKIDSVSSSVHDISEKCTKTNSESTEVLHSIQEIDSAISKNNENAIAVKDSSYKLSLMSDNLDSLINKFKVDNKDLTHYNTDNLISSSRKADKNDPEKGEENSDTIAARVQTV